MNDVGAVHLLPQDLLPQESARTLIQDDRERDYNGLSARAAMISVVAATQATASHAPQLATSAARNGLPTICEWDYMARAGYGHDLRYGQRRAGEYVARILKGAAPAELPVEQSDAWKLTVNLKAAAQLGLTISASLLARADEVIE